MCFSLSWRGLRKNVERSVNVENLGVYNNCLQMRWPTELFLIASGNREVSGSTLGVLIKQDVLITNLSKVVGVVCQKCAITGAHSLPAMEQKAIQLGVGDHLG